MNQKNARFEAALTVWLVSLFALVPAAFASVIGWVATIGFLMEGTSVPEQLVMILYMAGAPAFFGWLTMKMAAGLVARKSNGQVRAEPIVAACTSGFVLLVAIGLWTETIGRTYWQLLWLIAPAPLAWAGAHISWAPANKEKAVAIVVGAVGLALTLIAMGIEALK